MADEGGEKTEEPTHKKLQDARKKGQVWKSKDFSGVMVFCVGLGVVKATFPTLQQRVTALFDYGLAITESGWHHAGAGRSRRASGYGGHSGRPAGSHR